MEKKKNAEAMLLKVGIQLLAILKPVKRLGWWKAKFALFKRPETCGGGGWGRVALIQRSTPVLPNKQQAGAL